jgi:hypothetical protein
MSSLHLDQDLVFQFLQCRQRQVLRTLGRIKWKIDQHVAPVFIHELYHDFLLLGASMHFETDNHRKVGNLECVVSNGGAHLSERHFTGQSVAMEHLRLGSV